MNRAEQQLPSRSRGHLIFIVILFLMSRTIFLYSPAGRFGDADQAAFGMMAQKIAALEEFPLFFWENHYAGAPVAYLAAVIFHFFGSGFTQLRWTMILMIFPTYFLFYFIYKRLFDGQAALVCVLFLILSPYIVLNYTTGAYGGYGESFLGTALIALLSWRIDEGTTIRNLPFSCLLLGLICGFFVYIHLYVFPAALAFAVPVIWRLGQDRLKGACGFFIGGLIGILPLLVYNILNDAGTLTRGAAWVLLIGRDEVSLPLLEFLVKIASQKGAYLKEWLFNAPIMFGQYVVPYILGIWIQAAAGFALVVLFIAYAIRACKGIGEEKISFHHRQFALFLLIFVLFQWVASLQADRHFMPLFVVIPVALLGLAHGHTILKRGVLTILLLMGVLQTYGWYHDFKKPNFDPRPVLDILNKEGIREFYSSYWTAYPIMFLGNGNVIGAPLLLPYHEPFSDRRPQYTEQVVHSRDAAFVFGSVEESLKTDFLSFLEENHVIYKMYNANHACLFTGFSKSVGVRFDKQNWKNNFFLK